ncbi:DUF2231 domain-containing protein [Methylobacterium mesophilicum SR1.6/6]|uniref:DUF2231 domain-containing protein n=1 Tax=Methylobacterium mesophilicum SR1.6/6 TaxID=908290 RepID=A0A6B9FID8_9HYPH|nr:DUF2231 domain-containing protein [Methylobacterium mesophilicum SR1.6/6]
MRPAARSRDEDHRLAQTNPQSTARIGAHPIHAMLVPIPIACFVGTLGTDIAYWFTANMQWANFSAWLLSVGLIGAALAVLAGLIDFFGDRGIRRLRPAWIHVVGNVVAVGLSLINLFVHSRDAYTSVVPTGLILSAAVVLILLVTGWNGAALVHRHGVGVRNGERA